MDDAGAADDADSGGGGGNHGGRSRGEGGGGVGVRVGGWGVGNCGCRVVGEEDGPLVTGQRRGGDGNEGQYEGDLGNRAQILRLVHSPTRLGREHSVHRVVM